MHGSVHPFCSSTAQSRAAYLIIPLTLIPSESSWDFFGGGYVTHEYSSSMRIYSIFRNLSICIIALSSALFSHNTHNQLTKPHIHKLSSSYNRKAQVLHYLTFGLYLVLVLRASGDWSALISCPCNISDSRCSPDVYWASIGSPTTGAAPLATPFTIFKWPSNQLADNKSHAWDVWGGRHGYPVPAGTRGQRQSWDDDTSNTVWEAARMWQGRGEDGRWGCQQFWQMGKVSQLS